MIGGTFFLHSYSMSSQDMLKGQLISYNKWCMSLQAMCMSLYLLLLFNNSSRYRQENYIILINDTIIFSNFTFRLAFFYSISYSKIKVGTEFASKRIQQTLSLSDGFHSVLSLFCLFKALIHLFLNSAFINMLGKQYILNGGTQ